MPQVTHDGGAPAAVRVDPAELRRSGAGLCELGRGLAVDLRAQWPPLAAVAHADGWSATATARAAADQWREWLDGQAAATVTLGEGFARAADAYLRCDQHAATRQGDLPTPW